MNHELDFGRALFPPELSSSGAICYKKIDLEDWNVIVEVLEGQITSCLNVCTTEFEELASPMIIGKTIYFCQTMHSKERRFSPE